MHGNSETAVQLIMPIAGISKPCENANILEMLRCSFRYSRVRARVRARPSLVRRWASTGDEPKRQSGAPVNEDVLAKLRQFEEENKKLKQKLESQVRRVVPVIFKKHDTFSKEMCSIFGAPAL
jgi:hypothetical protein